MIFHDNPYFFHGFPPPSMDIVGPGSRIKCLGYLPDDLVYRIFTLCARQSCTGQQAIIEHQQLSDTIGLYGRFSAHTRISRQFLQGKGHRSKSQNRKKEIADDQENDMLT